MDILHICAAEYIIIRLTSMLHLPENPEKMPCARQMSVCTSIIHDDWCLCIVFNHGVIVSVEKLAAWLRKSE